MKNLLLAALVGATAPIAATSALAQASTDAITIVLPEAPPGLDPCDTSSSFTGRIVKNNIAEGLTEINLGDSSVKPRLATSWERKDDDTWTFKLREGVTFHDGAQLDADAVVSSIERTLTPELSCRTRSKYFNNLDLEVTAVDPTTVEITSDPPSPILPLMMSHLMIVAPDTSRNEKTRAPVGTGPYKFESWDPDQSVVLVRNEDYWGEQPEVGRATFVWRADSAVAAAMVETGEADFAPAINNQDATNKDTDFSYPNYETVRVRIGMSTPPLDDIRVRKALNLAVDREAFIGTILGADVQMATQLTHPSVLGHDPDLKPWPYDPEQAKSLIDEARADGVPVDQEIRLLTRPNLFPNSIEVLEALVQMWQSIGLNVNIMSVEAAQKSELDSRPHPANRPPTLSADQHDNASGDASMTLPYKYSNTGVQSDVEGYPALDELIVKGSISEGEERKQAFQEAFRMVHEEIIPDVVLFHMVGYARSGPRVSFPRDEMTSNELQVGKFELNQ